MGTMLSGNSQRYLGAYAAPVMLGEQQAMVLEVKPFVLHGVTYYDVTVAYQDRSVDHARLGPEGVPENLHTGEVVLAMRAANMIVSIRRPEPGQAPGPASTPGRTPS
jgi:hypothetical protein